MKFVTEEVLEGHARATRRGAIEGTLAGLALSVPASFALHRRWAYYRSLPITIKVLGVVLVAAPAFAVQAERRGVEFDKSQWTGIEKEELDREQSEIVARWGDMSVTQRIGDWASRHRYELFFGCWAGSMAVSWMLLRGNKTQSFSQKIVQARVYAQGITLVSLLGGVSLLHMQSRNKVKEDPSAHSWARLLEETPIDSRTPGVKAAIHA
ncbi:hypothetical protein SCHPADRAFT_932387 [Schizopora paradoxa]|uniref:HIG1 domain-containing protein n=1 Tax=Schizopora paradoxa TaxID=27342 RepID=A0A0H2R803_9AGAM|nr:hypothetical protein SCHPADRAFT_932387 [Schizopora paradoxa]